MADLALRAAEAATVSVLASPADRARLVAERLRVGVCPGCGEAPSGDALCAAARAAAEEPTLVTLTPPSPESCGPSREKGHGFAAARRHADDLRLRGWAVISARSHVYDRHGMLRADRLGAWRRDAGRSFQVGFRGKRARWNMGLAYLACTGATTGEEV